MRKSRRSFANMIDISSFSDSDKAYLHSLFDNDTRPYAERTTNILYEAIAERPEHPFEENLRVVKGASNRMFRAFYEYYRSRHLEKCEAFETKIKTSDIRLIGLYLQGMLHYCKQCGKACVREFCSQSCSAIYGNNHLSKETRLSRSKKMKAGLVERYGVNSYFGTDKFKAWSRCNMTNVADYNSEFVAKHFIRKENEFDIRAMISYFNISTLSAALVTKKRFGITQPNKHYANPRSKGEVELFDWIPVSNKRHNVRDILPSKRELDIYLPDYKLAIEYDGWYWHCDKFCEKDYHQEKTDGCEDHGVQLYTIFDLDDLDIWKSMILNKLGQSRRIYARKCEVRLVDYHDIREFLAENHLQGAVASPINYALYYENELVEVMTFKRPRFTKDYDFELLRLCTKKGITVVGGASKLWTAFRREHPTASVISYANRRFSQGKVYRTLGFSLVKTTAPNYVYVRQDEVVTRYQAQKHRLPQLLGEGYDPNLSEFENMTRAGFERMYDCGNMVFEFLPDNCPP